MALPPDRVPVIAGVGEITDRPADIAQGLEPVALMPVGVEGTVRAGAEDLLHWAA